MAYIAISNGVIIMSATRLPEKTEKPQLPMKPFSFDPETAKIIQDAGRFRFASELFLVLSALACILCYFAEVVSFSRFTDWLPEQLLADSQSLQRIFAILSFLALAFLILFGFSGIYSLYTRGQFQTTRLVFIWLSVALILPPLAMRVGWYFRIIIFSGLCNLFCRWLAKWAGNQRPHDWRIILAEKRRLNWGPLELASALTKGKSSDGHPLAFVLSENTATSHFKYEVADEVKYEKLTSLLTLTLKHRYPWSNVNENWEFLIALLIEHGCTEEERNQLSRTWLYVHSEVEDRVSALIGPSCERGFGPGVSILP
jgi:uncharacterized membrane protein (DUF485 family)